MFEWRLALRKALLRLVRGINTKAQKKPIVRKDNFLYHNVKMPVWLLADFTFFVLFFVMLLELGVSWRNFIGLSIFISVIIFGGRFYLKRNSPEILSNNNLLALLSAIGTMIVITMMLVLESKITISGISPYIVPVPAAAMLTTILLGSGPAMMLVAFLSVILGVLNNFSFDCFFIFLVGGMAGVGSVLNVRNRRDLTRAGLYVNMANVCSILILGILQDGSYMQIAKNTLWGLGNGFLSVVLTIGMLPYLENAFSITTNIKLLELADFNQPLLKRLMLEAPGTYHHSLLVGNLVEKAADIIGANSLLARVGAYYHDIGKLNKAEYFIENISALKSKHDTLAPTMSSLILVSHVKEGVSLAKENNLDKAIIDIIEQHHGSCLIHFFYQRALEEYKAEEVHEGNYRYPGPKPQTREAALVMLADAVEAASRSLEEPTHRKIRDMVNKIVNNKFIDEQLNECNITLANLHRIAESFIHSLISIYHPRIEYPEYAEGEKSKGNENIGT